MNTPDLRVLALGAGVQSTTLALMAAKGEIEKPDCAIFADTGWEPKAVYTHLEWLEEQIGHIIPIIRVSKGNLRADLVSGKRVATPPVFLLNPDGTAGMLRRQCTSEYKIQPINREIRRQLKEQGGRVAELWFGITLDEAQRMKDSPIRYVVNRYPLIEKAMYRQSCLIWIEQQGYPSPPKSACVGCPFRSNHSWRKLRDADREEWNDAVAFDAAIRDGLPGVRGNAYLHRSLVPLDQVDLRTEREKGQSTLWDDFTEECSGHCGL